MLGQQYKRLNKGDMHHNISITQRRWD